MQPSRHYLLVNKEIRSPDTAPPIMASLLMAEPGRLLHNNEDDDDVDNAQQQELAAAVVRNK